MSNQSVTLYLLPLNSMSVASEKRYCKNCGMSGYGKYCSECGQSFDTGRITISHIVHEAFHFFTHFEKGFGYTLKQLVISPGYLQKKYLQGQRSKIQKPFSMFFICASLCGLCLYLINSFILKYEAAGDEGEIHFFQHYLVLVQICMVPFYALVSWLFFIRSGYNYAELLIVILYTVSVFFLLLIPIQCLKFLYPHLNTKYIEVPIFIIYNLITYVNLLNTVARWKVILLSIGNLIVSYSVAQIVQQAVIHYVQPG